MKTTAWLMICLATTVMFGIGNAGAAPYTAFFEGTTVGYWDWYAGMPVTENEGQPLSIRVTFDIANGTLQQQADPNYSYSVGGSERGCREIVNGVCAQDSGGALPVVTDWSIMTPFAPAGGIRPFSISLYYWDGSARINQRLSGIYDPPQDIFVIVRIQEQCNVTGDLAVAYTRTCVSTYFNLQLAATKNTFYPTLADLMDLNHTPNFADVAQGAQVFVLFMMNPTEDCALDADGQMACVTTYGPGSTSFGGIYGSLVILGSTPTNKEQCKNGGWKAFGFKNQGQCVKYVNHL